MQGRMEFAAGAGQPLDPWDPRSPTMQKVLDQGQHRESFRPFAPSVLHEDARTWFDLDGISPYMRLVALSEE
jgi:carbamoyltransferase